MSTASEYQTNSKSAMIGDRECILVNKIPVFANTEDREKRVKSVEHDLYSVFRKYMS